MGVGGGVHFRCMFCHIFSSCHLSPAVGVGGGVHFRHDTKGGGRGSCLAEEGEVPYMKGQLYDLLNSERFTIDYNDIRNLKCKNLGG